MPTPETIREVTQEILQRPEFGAPSAWDEFVVYLLNRLLQWMKGVAAWAAENPELAKIVAIGLALLSLAALAHILYLALGDLLPLRRRQHAAATRPSRWEILEGTARSWQEALEIARRLLREGNLRRAVWIAHRVMLGLLDEEGAIRFAGWKTNSHYLRECARTHRWYTMFSELTGLYERLIYAHRVVAPAAVESLVLEVERLSRGRVP